MRMRQFSGKIKQLWIDDLDVTWAELKLEDEMSGQTARIPISSNFRLGDVLTITVNAKSLVP